VCLHLIRQELPPKSSLDASTKKALKIRAKEYARMIESGLAKSESDLARKIGISRVRVCQYVRLLSLDASIVKAIEQLSDPLTERMITERRLRPYLRKTPKEQKEIIAQIKQPR